MGLHNLARMTTATTGTGTITLGSAVSGFLSFAGAGVADGEVVTYAIRDGANSEIGSGTYTSSGTTLSRTTIYNSTNSNNAIDLSGSAQVFITPAAVNISRVFLAESTPTGTGTVTFASIPGTYKKLLIEFTLRGTQAADTVACRLQFNGDTTDANYHRTIIGGISALNNCIIIPYVSAGNLSAGYSTTGKIEIVQYAETNFYKRALCPQAYRYDANDDFIDYTAVTWFNTAAITDIVLVLSAGNYASGSVLRLYGEN